MKTLKFLAQLGMVIVCAVLISGCNSAPSSGDAEKVLRQQIESESGGQIKLVSFKKTDGQKFVENAIQRYKMDYEVEIEFKSDGTWLTRDILNHSHDGLTFSFSASAVSHNVFDQISSGAAGGTLVHNGDRGMVVGVMEGEKKESGWKFRVGENHFVSTPASSPTSSSTSNSSSQAASAMQESASKEQSESSKEFSPCPVPTESRLWGYINQSGSFIIPPTYTVVGYFIDGFAPVSMSENNNLSEDPVFSCIDVTGKVALNAVKKNGAVSYVNAQGQTVGFSELPLVLKNKLIRSCANNLRKIDAAKNQWALEKGKRTGDRPLVSDLTSYMRLTSEGKIPGCPEGGTYTINPVGKNPECSFLGHVLP